MKVHDEVCGMTIEAERAAKTFAFQGKRYYFCSERCRRMFEEHPERYVLVSDEDPHAVDYDQHQHHH